ncbi:hypothetical protein [Streptomyces sp. cg2]|uniref:hypothetical protein n=1 Tax=Streptomyces sp. cg2 TaxID=3238799 RepID=UPI0034E26867
MLMPAKESTFEALIDAYGPALARLWDREDDSPCTAWELSAAAQEARAYVHLSFGQRACDEMRWRAADDAFTAVVRDLDAALDFDDPKDVRLLLWRAEQYLRVGLALVTADF